ncbi:MAG TPA: hypothetical protein VFF31_00710 [Blastocatellia bacterium]|nr:hypothetical protein [Blastocatellia bacterium]
MNIFSLGIYLGLVNVSFEGPIPVTLTMTYHGKDPIEIMSDEFIDIEFEPPQGWTLKERPKLRNLTGILPTTTLSNGQSLSRQIYLHDYFSSITPGDTKLTVVVKVWPKSEGKVEPFVLREFCSFKVMGPDPEGFKDRIRRIHQQILSEKSAEKRLELYKSLASLSHADLIPIFLESLLDPHMLVFHLTARRRLVDLAEKYGKRDSLIAHLANHGGRYDAEFFRLWQEKQIRLTEEEISRLCESSSLWVRLFCLENYGKQYNRKGLIDSLKSELKELTERAQNLRYDQ